MSSPSENRKFCFIVNPRAGVGQAGELQQLIGQHAAGQRAEFDIQYTQAQGHATELAVNASRQGVDVVVAVGGDGTINEVAKGLLNSSSAMGIVPRGSGNGLARHLGIPLNTAGAIDALFTSHDLFMDVFTVNGKLSLNVSGIGFDGHITSLFGVKSSRGLLGYVTVTAQEFTRFQEFTAEITLGGNTSSRRAFIIAIANSSQYGNNAVIAPAASVCDGLLNINFLKKIPLYRMDFLYDFFAGRVGQSPYSDIIEASALTVVTHTPVPYHVDGEPAGVDDHFSIQLTAKALRVLSPAATGTRV